MELPNLILFDDPTIRGNLMPFTFTRPVSEIRIGILTITEKWELLLKQKASFLTVHYLSEKYPLQQKEHNLYINGSVLPDASLVEALGTLKSGEWLTSGNTIIAQAGHAFLSAPSASTKKREYTQPYLQIKNLWDIFTLNGRAIEADFKYITRGRSSQPADPTNQVIGAENIFIEPGAKVKCSVLNAETGCIFIGKDAEVMEGSLLRGPLALCEHATVKMGAKIYGATTIGPAVKAGGEINNSVFLGFCNKAHDGFIGNSVIGEWCNIGADSNNSNLKNNYAPVKLWHYPSRSFIDTGLQFCGLFMGDHSKCGINTMFNTGTVVGFSCNIFGAGFPRTFIPSFSWGGPAGFVRYQLDKAMETAERMMARRGLHLSAVDIAIWKHIYEQQTLDL
ncbi:MAG: glucose-1-phosphate thymidylyltransferase [Chitinophagales bacterium]|nr:MAG: glucose-1-phosphate thymidylyltransferase [Chitinophagales bacterium]